MIDNFSIALSHGLMFLVAWRLYFRRDLDVEAPPKIYQPPAQTFSRQR
jgi:hypothetical protein